ncbi:hypothetical protein C3L33_13669, partial [Rhododendron williamsianum]
MDQNWFAVIDDFIDQSKSVGFGIYRFGSVRRNFQVDRSGVAMCPRPPAMVTLVSDWHNVVVALLGSSSSSAFDSVSPTPRPDIYTNYRRIKEQAASDYLELRSLSSEATSTREFSFCGKDTENYVPCYNVSGNLLVGLKDGEEFDSHCEVSREQLHCLVRPPKEYKIPLKWPAGKDVIWSGNVKICKDQFLSSGSMTKRLMLLEENQISFHSEDGLIYDGVKDYSHQIAEMIGLGSDAEFYQAGVRTVLDIGCGFGSFGSHLLSLKLMVVWIAAYEVTGSKVQLALERGLPAIIGNFISRQLPYPSLSFSMVHCAQCGIFWEKKGVQPNDFYEDFENWKSVVTNYWSLLTPLIFSDHPKRPGDEDPLPPYNMIRNQGWVIVGDKLGPIEKARSLATQIRWEARVIDLQNGSDQRLLVCQKPFLRK